METKNNSKLSDFVLQSFNLLDQNIVGNLTRVIDHLTDIRDKSKIETLLNNIATVTEAQTNIAKFTENKSEQETYEAVAASFGLKASYSFYSGSVQTSVSSEKYKSSTAYSASCVGEIHIGTTHFNGANVEMINFLQESVVDSLKNIQTLDEAKTFIDNYGTHIVKGWNLGGSFSLLIHASTSSYENKFKVSADVSAGYSGVGSVEASASMSYELNQKGKEDNLEIKFITIGGDADIAKINIQEKNTNISDWVQTCNKDTSYGINEIVSFSELADLIGLEKVSKLLTKYIDLFMLSYSLQNPTILTNHILLSAFESNEAVVTSDKENFRIISGGAMLPHTGASSSNVLTGTYPIINQKEIQGWKATSHDCMEPSGALEYLTVYGLSVFDPGKYLKIEIEQNDGTNKGTGADQAIAKLNMADFALISGGCRTIIGSGSFPKYLVSTYPKELSGKYSQWVSQIQDYDEAASDVSLTSFVIGIKAEGLSINPIYLVISSDDARSDGEQSASLPEGINVIGGGVLLGPKSDGNGNLLRSTYPENVNTWTEYNKDQDNSVSKVTSTTIAIGLSITINGILDQPKIIAK